MKGADKITTLKDLLKNSKPVIFSLAIVIFIAFANSLNNEFISDDLGAIVHNPDIASLSKTIRKNPTGFFPSAVESIVFQLVGTNPPLFHLNNLLWHFGVSVLVYFVTLLLFQKRDLAVVTAFLFALHPIHTENVTWISGLSYIVYTFFTLSALLIYLLIDKEIISQKFIVILVLSSSLAFLSSYHAIVLPAVLILYIVTFSSVKRGIKILWPVLTTALLFGLSYLGPFTRRVSDFAYTTKGTFIVMNPLIQIPVAIVSYLKLLSLPIGLTLYHERITLSPWMLALYIIVVLALFFSCLLLFKRSRLIFFGLMLFFISLSPTLLPVFISWLVAERYVYLGSLGIILIISYLLLLIRKKSQALFWILFIFICSSYFFLTVKRNTDWKNQDTLWPATVAVSPGSTLAHNNMGDYYARHGDLKNAIKEFGKAVALRPDNADALHNLGFTYLQMGEATKAAELFNMALSYNPKLIESVIGLYTIDKQAGKYDRAKADLEYALKINPNSPLIYNVLALQMIDTNKKDEAVQLLKKALEIDPNYLPAKQNLEIISRQ